MNGGAVCRWVTSENNKEPPAPLIFMAGHLPPWLEGCVIAPPLPSRKNLVFRVRWRGRTCAAKVFGPASEERAATEYRVLGLCRERRLRTPRPIVLRDGVVIMSWLSGMPAFEVFLSRLRSAGGADSRGRGAGSFEVERSQVAPVLDGVAAWLAGFHRAFRCELRRGDAILKNFICSGKVIYGIDFEEAREGDPLEDVGQLCAHILASGERFMTPLFDAARYFALRYWARLGEDRSGELPRAVASGLEHYARYRRDGPLLRQWARRIRDGGL